MDPSGIWCSRPPPPPCPDPVEWRSRALLARLFEAMGYQDLGAVPNWVRPLAPHRILPRLDPAALGLSSVPSWTRGALEISRHSRLAAATAWTGGLALRAAASVRRLRSVGISTVVLDGQPAAKQLDDLWEAARGGYHAAVVRNAAYLVQRYPAGPSSDYVWLTARHRGRLAGVAVVRRPRADGDERLKGIRVATLADVLYRPDRPAVGLALLGAVERSVRDLGADAILATTSAPALQQLLRRQWYLPLSGNVHLLFRDASAEPAEVGPVLTDWWISRGDGQADEGV